MFKKITALSLMVFALFASVSAQAGNEYGVVAEIRYNSPTEVEGVVSGASIVVMLEADPDNYAQYSEVDSCFADGVQGWYINLDANPVINERILNRLEKAEADRTVVRLFNDAAICDSGDPQFNATIVEAYFYR
jgi:hypothetical protein